MRCSHCGALMSERGVASCSNMLKHGSIDAVLKALEELSKRIERTTENVRIGVSVAVELFADDRPFWKEHVKQQARDLLTKRINACDTLKNTLIEMLYLVEGNTKETP